MELKDSRTKENLMRAFAGESQARNRYTFAAQLAKENNLYVIKKVFDLTASQEKEHGEVFYQYLNGLEGEEISIEDAAYPVNTSEDVSVQLQNAVENETKEADEVYRTFGDIALEEGFHQIAGKFYMIADIEKVHAERFGEFLKLLKEGKLFASDVKTGWMCLHCGYVIESTTAPQNCPVCDSNQGYFIRLSMAPFTEEKMDTSRPQNLGKK
ncbi:MAG: ferritin family protein [Butyribacter sp.]|nr:ferritin family protein [bacterium]MDY3853459.1 ferritin family protein [Butyribacter sp.]